MTVPLSFPKDVDDRGLPGGTGETVRDYFAEQSCAACRSFAQSRAPALDKPNWVIAFCAALLVMASQPCALRAQPRPGIDRLPQVSRLQPAGPQIVPQVPLLPSGDGPREGNPVAIPQPWSGIEGHRLPFLQSLPPELRSPAPNAATQKEYESFLEKRINPEVTLNLIEGRPQILVFREPPRRIYLPQDEIVTFQVIDERQISLVGRKIGTSVLNIWVNDAPQTKILSYLIRVVPDPERLQFQGEIYKHLEQEINKTFPDSHVTLSLVGDQVVVRGEAKDVLEASQILRIVEQNAPVQRPANQDLGNLKVAVQQSTLGFPGSAIGLETAEVGVEGSGSGLDLLTGLELQSQKGVINLLRIPGVHQVMLRVTVAEVNRTAARSLGINFSTGVFQQLTGNILSTTGANLRVDNGQFLAAINALRTQQLARTLAEPNLTTLHGRTARFQAGGQFPVPVVTGFASGGLQGVTFVPFGVQLRFTPYIVDRDLIRLQVAANVSTRDESLGTNIGGSAAAGGTNVAGINTRNFTTTLELREGQTLAVAGLIQGNFGASTDRVPLWGDLPFVGMTGGFNRTSAAEQELVILITPELVEPLNACETPSLPGSDIFEPGDIEFYLYNRLESRRTEDYRSPVRTDFARQMRYHHCEDEFIIGPSGPTYGCCDHERMPRRGPPRGHALRNGTCEPCAQGSRPVTVEELRR